jgi:protein-L-isoaspartate(D-aspartate) O-methyltransferase
MNTATPPADPPPEVLRTRMVDRVVEAGHARSSRVEETLREVPRHRFVPVAAVEEAYADRAVITKRGADGAALSCASVPSVVAMMLDQLDVAPGNRILEIGAGTGYNAALLAHLTGPSGEVTSVDIDEEVTAQARQALDATGYGHVRVVTGDGAGGDAGHAPYDRIIVTVGAWDLPPDWWAQLVPGGGLVVPLRWRGQTRSVAFTHEGGRMRSDSVELCGFVPMIGQDGEHTGHIDINGQVALSWDDDQPIDPASLRGVLDRPKTAAWSTVIVDGSESFDGVWLRLTGAEPGTCRIAAEASAVDTGLCTPAIPVRSPALVEGSSLAYLSLRPQDEASRWELGAIGHGPAGPELAGHMCEQIRAWGRDRTSRPVISAYPADTPDDQIVGAHAIPKRFIRLVVSL